MGSKMAEHPEGFEDAVECGLSHEDSLSLFVALEGEARIQEEKEKATMRRPPRLRKYEVVDGVVVSGYSVPVVSRGD